MILKPLLSRDDKGIGAVEFALVAPVLIAFIVGVSQLGRMFYANADMKNAIAHGARVASVYSDPPISDATIIAAVNDRLMRDGANTKATTTVFRGTDNGNPYVELRVTYSVPLEFIFFSPPAVTLKDTRKVFTQVILANQTTVTSSGVTSSGVTSSGVTSSGVTSSGVTSSGGDTSSGVTSSGGDTSSGVTSSGSNGSNGNGSSGNNNGSSGHAHGNCNNNC